MALNNELNLYSLVSSKRNLQDKMGNNSIEKMRGLIHTLNKFGRQQLNNSWYMLTKIEQMMRVLYFLFQNAIRCLVCYFGRHFSYCFFSTLLNTLDCCVSHSVRGLYRMNIFSLSIVCTFFTFFSKYCRILLVGLYK